MEYQNKLSRLRQAFLKLQGQDLKQVLLRAAAKRAEEVANNVYTTEEIFHAISEKIYKDTNELSWNEAFVLASDAESLAILKKELIESVVENFEWEETLHVLLEGLSKEDLAVIKPLMKNQHMHLLHEEASCGSSSSNRFSGFRKMMIPMVRRIFENMPLRHLVGIQPMQGPVGLAYFLRYRSKDEETGNYEDYIPCATEDKKIRLEVVSQAHEAGTRQLEAGWTIEAMADLKSFHGLDVEAEMVVALSNEIRNEITSSTVNDLYRIAGEPEIVKLDGSLKDQINILGITINRTANEIARKTRRGAGNWIVVPYLLSTFFKPKYFSKGVFAPIEKDRNTPLGDLQQIGTLNGCIRVYTSFGVPDDEILVGYKGGNGESDAGYSYCPYIPIMSSGVVVDADTFQPTVRLMTRSGRTLNGKDVDPKEASKCLASNYYEVLKIESELFISNKKESSGKDS